MVRLRLVQDEDPNEHTTKWYIQHQDDYYHPEDIIAFVIPPFVPAVHLALRFGAIASALNAKLFATLGS